MKIAILKNLPAKTGHGLDHWLGVLQQLDAPDKRSAISQLKQAGLGHFQAAAVYERSVGEAKYDDAAGLEAKQFNGNTTYADLKKQLLGFGKDVSVRPCQTYVPFYAKRVFAMAAPSAEGMQIGLALDEATATPEAEKVDAFKGSQRMTHVINLPANATLSDGQRDLLHRAYQNNAK
ncbi:DUF5655 domain-containing protein [Lewinella sp. 4G2]|uniref:DUF5655 domain-containing protein n=1 Tax=Lewinella sp. 4G2 TaxID=1803372 RepID=UPI0007B4B68C|nr:DUF5655 domain-containing protein [Lewinella sp. 4G2]OAV44772.1 hypothetical protein A3850_009845 [Lewinella sp. 4G2]